MKKIALLIIVGSFSLNVVQSAEAQYQGTDAKYAQERSSARSNRLWIKLGGAGLVLALSGGAWIYKKIKGE